MGTSCSFEQQTALTFECSIDRNREVVNQVNQVNTSCTLNYFYVFFLVKLTLSSLWHGDIASLCARLEAAGKTKIIQKNREADTLSYKQGTARIFYTSRGHIYQRHVHEAFPNASKEIEALYDTVDEMEKRARPTILTNFGAGYLVVGFLHSDLPLIGLQGTCSRHTFTSGGLFPSVKLHSAISILKVLMLVAILLAWQI